MSGAAAPEEEARGREASGAVGRRRLGRWLVILPPYLWLLAFFLIPFAIVFKISLAELRIAQPPFTPLFDWSGEGLLPAIQATLDNYRFLLEDNLYWVSYLSSLRIALVATFICLLIGYPMAYGIARASSTWRIILLLLVILPFWTSLLLRVYAWIGILQTNGFLNSALLSLGLISRPLPLIYNEFAVYVGIVYTYLPFMILPLYATLEKMDRSLLEAAEDLGAGPVKTFVTITLPLSFPGILAGSLLVFIPAVGEFVIPELLGGPNTLMVGRVLWNEFFANRDWPVASAVAVVLLLVIVLPVMVFQRYLLRQEERSP